MNIKPKAAKEKSKIEPRAKKLPKRITQTYLHNSGLYYLQRFAASSGHFREVMLRKVKKSCHAHEDQNYEDCVPLVDTLVETFKDSGILDDDAYARGMVTSLRRQGKSKRAIMAKMKSKSVPAYLTVQMLEKYDQERPENDLDAEREAVLIFARKKRLGPFRNTEKEHPEDIEKKELGKLARAGFSYETSRFVFEVSEDKIDDYRVL